ncbi:MAG: IclR family transcriptional regulator [Acidobacteriota bacterium]
MRKEPPGPAPATGRKRHLVPMIIKSFDVLEAFRERPEGLTYKELVERYPRISKVSIYRILCSLEAVGYLRKDAESGKFQLGSKFIELGRITEKRQDIVRIARPYMERALEKFDENVNLAKIEGQDLIYLCTLEGSHPLRVIEMPNRLKSVYCSAVGKAILANLPEAEQTANIDNMAFVKLTPHTITSKRALRQELRKVVKEGYAVDDEENLIGVRCAGAAILNDRGYPVAGISITAPSSRLTAEKASEVGGYLSALTKTISTEQFGLREGT